jgi:hypothetical protein
MTDRGQPPEAAVHVSHRIRSATVAAATVAALPLLTAQAASAAPAASATSAAAGATAKTASSAGRPGLAGTPITLADHAEFSGYDAATDGSGTAYIGWIGDTGSGRKVSLCTLPRGATSCAGGIQTIDSLGDSSAQDLRVLVTPGGQVTLIWFHDTTASESGPQGSEIAIATSQSGGPLSGPADVATAPSFGSMLDAVLGPDNNVWVVTQPSGATSALQIRPGLSNSPVTIHAPYFVGTARLAFSGSTAVLAVDKAGAITLPVSFATSKGSTWSAFRKVARTWTSDASFDLVRTSSGVRLMATVSDADYFPVVSRWTGSGFSKPSLTGDRNNCSPSSHDTVADASGRMADVSIECSDVAIANLTDTLHAADVRFNARGTFAGGIPQLTTAPSGKGWVAWSIESSGGDKLLVAPVLLPGRSVTVSRSAGGNRVTLKGPASCLPPVTAAIAVSASPAAHWRTLSKELRLGGSILHSTTLHGDSLTPGKKYTLTGSVTFARASSHRTVSASLSFRTCPK